MHTDFLDTQLAAYLSVREALGFQMRAELLLPEFVAFLHAQGITGPIRARLALEWACQASAHRGPGGAALASVSHGGFSPTSRPPHQTPKCQTQVCYRAHGGPNRTSLRRHN